MAGYRTPGALRLMAVHAHPDDESSKGAATMARYAAECVQVMVVACTGGERGDILNPAADHPAARRDIGAVRRAEMARACEILGIEHRFLGFADSGLPPGGGQAPLPAGCFARQPLETAAAPLVRAIREFRPHVLLTYDESGGYPHPDHIMCHEISVEAFGAAGDPGRYAAHGMPWQPAKLYYHAGFHRLRFRTLHAELRRRGLAAPGGQWREYWGEFHPWQELPVTTRVPCGDHFETRDRALLAHATQIDPHSSWFAFSPEVQRAAWPTEDFHLARSLVDTELPEDDLFAGIAAHPLAPAGVSGRADRGVA